jgi:polysaccharide export outer membrane protein
LEEASDTTLLKLLAVSEGVLPSSSKLAYIYRKQPGRDQREEVEVPLKQILSRKKPDIPIQADDILYIPENSGQRMTLSVLERVVGFGATTASGVLIYGRMR